jgi:hypothetical protein
VAGHPADVGRAPVHRVRLDVEDVVVGGRHPDQIAARGVDDGLGLGRGPTRIEQVEQVLGVHLLARAGGRVARLGVDQLVPPVVAALLHGHVAAAAPQDRDRLDRRRVGQSLVGTGLERDHAAAPPAMPR